MDHTIAGDDVGLYNLGFVDHDTTASHFDRKLCAIYGFGLPFYSAATFVTRGLHACKDMKSPVRIAGVCLLVNFFGSITLMQFLGVQGLAISNVLAAMVQAVCLWRALVNHHRELSIVRMRSACFKILGAGMIMGVFCVFSDQLLQSYNLEGKRYALATIGFVMPLCVVLYVGLLYLLKFEELKLLLGRVKEKVNR